MSSPASIALSSGFDALLSAAGEPMTFRGVQVQCLVDTRPDLGRSGRPDFGMRQAVAIELRDEFGDAHPEVGEYLTDSDSSSRRYRIQRVERIDFTYRLTCDVYDHA